MGPVERAGGSPAGGLQRHPTILIVGSGPAGCAAARLLALWGHRVLLVTRRPANGAPLAESIPPSGRKLLDLVGAGRAVDEAGFIRSTGNTVWWGEGEARVERFAPGDYGWQVTDAALAAVLLESVREAGVPVQYRSCTVAEADAFPIVLDGSGRRGLFARARGWRVYEPAHRTVALAARWRAGGAWRVPDPTHTVVESYADGWAWSVPLADGCRHVAVMVDPRASDLIRGGASRRIYLAELAKTRRFATLLEDGRLEGGPWGWDASMYGSRTYADERVWLVGDAASFVDPLSSAGVQKALASGWLAAVAINTALAEPSMAETARAFFAAREAEMYDGLRHQAARHLAEAAADHPRPFWQHRLAAWDPAAEPDDLASHALRSDPGVSAAFAFIRQAPALMWRQHPELRVESRPAVSGTRLVLERRLLIPGRPQGIRYVLDVDVLTLLEAAPGCSDAGALFEEYCRRAAPVTLPDFLLVLATAVARGWLAATPAPR